MFSEGLVAIEVRLARRDEDGEVRRVDDVEELEKVIEAREKQAFVKTAAAAVVAAGTRLMYTCMTLRIDVERWEKLYWICTF